jgi:uncharacterized membrane protein
MEKVEKTLDVNVPVHTAYNQWTQFEDFPQFMDGVELVKQLDDKHLLWRAKVGGKEEEWQADITEQVPDQRIAWHSTTGAKNAGLVTFQPQGSNRTRITLRLDYDPEGMVENVGDKMGFMSRQVEKDLKNFKEFIESRGTSTGAWRGEIHGQDVKERGSGPRS